MKLSDLLEYNMGIQGKDANAKSKVDDAEIDVPGEEIPDPKADNDVEKQLSQGSRKVGAIAGKKIQGTQFASGAGKVSQGKMPNKTELKQLAPIIGDVTKAMSDPKFANRLGAILKQAGKEGVDESTLAKKILKKLTSKKPGKGIRKKSRLLQEIDENLFEINFNKKGLAKEALDLPIRCGFEAETVWDSISGGGSGQDIDDMAWYEVEETLYISNRDEEYINEGFNEWVRENKVDDYYSDVMDRYLENERDNDESYERFMEDGDGPTADAVKEYKDNLKDEDPNEYENREEDGWEFINWCREYIDEEYEDDYLDFVREYLDEDGEVFQEAFDEAYNETSIDEWISEAFYSMSSFCDDYGIDYSELGSGDLEEVANSVYEYTKNTQFNNHIQTGEYGETSGDTDEWAVETDSSIDAGTGTGAEIISPVYSTPREMLEDMSKFFDHIKSDASTNSSTGLHVTMSWNGEAGGYEGSNNAEANKLKMATLLGDTYLLSTFGRENNSYTKQQSKNVKKKAADAVKASTKGTDGIKDVEEILGAGISNDKFSSINFKDIRDRDTGTKLIEFRIGGGDNYHLDLPKIAKAVVRYATIMEAGYTDKYNKDYVNAMYKIVNNAGKIDSKDLERAKERFDLDHIKEPLVELFKTVLSKDNYFDGVGQIANAYKNLRESEKVKEAERIGVVQPEGLELAQKYYIKAMAFLATDVATGKHRNRVSAQNIGVIRKSLKEFKLTESEFSDKIMRSLNDINIPTQNDQTKQKVGVIKKGIEVLFKKEILEEPSFLNIPKAEFIAKGSWNAIHSDNWSKQDQEKLINLLVSLNFGKGANKDDDRVHNMRVSILQILDKKEFNSFYSGMVRSSYNITNPPAKTGEPYYDDQWKELSKFLKSFKNYDEPVAKDHNANISGDDSYIENFLNSYVMRLRKRFQHFNDLRNDNPQLYYDSLPKLAKMTEDFIKGTQEIGENWEEITGINSDDLEDFHNDPKVKDAYRMLYNENDGNKFLAIGEYATEKLNGAIDRIVKKDYSDPFGGTPDYVIGERVTDSIRDMLGSYYKKKGSMPTLFTHIPELKDLISKRFSVIKDWAKEFDALSQKMGFETQAGEIADKQVVDKREKQFNKNAQKDVLTLNIPSHSSTYMRTDLYNKLTDSDYSKESRKNAQIQNRKYFTTKINSEQVFVLPAAHWSQAHDALEIQRSDSLHPKWRQGAAQKVMKSFYKTYGKSYSDINGASEFTHLGAEELQSLKKNGIAITHDGDSREPHVEPLVPNSETEQPNIGTPMSITSAAAWHVNNPELSKKARAEDDKDSEKRGLSLIKAAGVESNTRESSNSIARETDWSNLAKHLGIEPGVNDQGIKLLKQTYEMFDGNSQGNYAAEGSSIERWVDAVKKAKKYIETNYKVSGGNYFRNEDKSNVSAVYSTPDEVSETDYETARNNYPAFDNLMRRGIGNYIKRNDVNDVVAFLNSPNTLQVKTAVLNALEKNGEDGNLPIDLASAKSIAGISESMINITMANIFENFEELSLEKQLEIIRNERISESLGDIAAARLQKQRAQQQDYKQEMVTIWDSQPWPLPGSWDNKRLADAGFKRFSKGWKISKDKFDAIANPVRKSRIESLQVTEMLIKAKRLSENLPNNNKIDIINDILSKEFPVGDIDIQFKAFTAMPIPRMMTDFSRLHSAQPNADGRDIVKHYAETRLSDQDIKKLKLNENKNDLIDKLNNLPDDENTNKLINYVEQLIDDMGVGGRIKSLSKEIEGIPDEDVKKAVRQIAKIVASVEMSPQERAELFVNWKADKIVNVDALLNTQTVTMSDIYIGYGDKGESHITELVDDLNQVVQYGIGPGEFALAVLSQRISGMGASSGEDGGKGDLIIDGQPIELKTTRKNAARFNDREVTISNDYKTLVTDFFTKYKDKIAELEQSGTKVKVGSGMQQAHVAAFLKAVPEAQDEVGNIISNIFTNLAPIGGKIAQLLKSQDINGAMQLIAQSNVNNYLAKKRSSGNVAGILFIDLKKETFNFIKDVADLEGTGLRLHAKTNYLITTNENPFANTSIVPGTSRISEGKKHNSCPRTKAPVCHCESINKLTESEQQIKALCEFEHSNGNVKGLVYLEQNADNGTTIHGNITGLEEGEHGFHIHEFGDLSKGCESAGGHYNPDNVDHGDLQNGHIGDLGNVVADSDGNAKFKIKAERVELSDIVGRALVIHADEDDLGKGGDAESLKTGNAGDRLACGVIRLMSNSTDESITEVDAGTQQAKTNNSMTRRAEQERLARMPQTAKFKRAQMPQLKDKQLLDPNFRKKHDLEIKSGTIGLDRIKPAQVDRVAGLSDSAKKFFAKGQTPKPFIIDRNGMLVNGHHRYDAALMLGVKRIPFIAIDRTIDELVKMFGPGSEYNLASKTGGVDGRKVKGFSGVKPEDVPLRPINKRSVAAIKAWQKKKYGDSPSQQEFNFDKDEV